MTTSSTDRPFGVAPPHDALPSATHLGCVTLQVSNLDRSVTYYRDLIGLNLVDVGASTASMGATGTRDVLLRLVERRGARPAPSGGVLGLYHFAMLLPDRPSFGRFIRHLLARQVQFGSADHFVSESTYLWDPDGLGIEVYADRPRHTWRTRGRELLIGTAALHLQSAIEAGGNEPWSGMPTTTTMGHMHLSVSDLSRARDFYHTTLGFDAIAWSYPGALFMSAGGYHHHLGTNIWAAAAPPAADDDARLLEWELIVPQTKDINAAATRLRAAGYDSRDGLTVDPWGTRLRLRAQEEQGTKNEELRN